MRYVSEETAKVIEDWFCGEMGGEVEGVSFDVGLVKNAVLKNGGGWHGLGWIGEGKWVVKKGQMDESGKCCCGEQLCCVDADDVDTERFAQSIAGLAMEREVKANFSEFQVRGASLDLFNLVIPQSFLFIYSFLCRLVFRNC